MLIRFTVENFLSFNQETEFSMIASSGRLFPEHVMKEKGRNNINILKAGVIYGANAAGKSNLIKAMAFARRLVLRGTESNEIIAVKPFRLDAASLNKPTKFEFEFKYQGTCYAYGFSINATKVLEEWLYKVNKTTENPIFRRTTNDKQQADIDFHVNFSDQEEEQFFKFLAKGTRPNQLFLTEAIDRNATDIKAINHCFKWFYEVLNIVFPESKYLGLDFVGDDDKLSKDFGIFLKLFGTGIEDVATKRVDLEDAFKNLPDKIQQNIKLDARELPSGSNKSMLVNIGGKVYNIHRDNHNELKVAILMTKHKVKPGATEVLFDIEDESDGTQRLFDLIPALLDVTREERVYIIDELDRSLHALLSIHLLKLFFKKAQKHNSQLIVTTHEAGLLDLNLLRKDEVWFVEKNKWGESQIYSLEEFKPRYDKDIRRGYLQGRYGAIPFIGNLDSFIPEETVES